MMSTGSIVKDEQRYADLSLAPLEEKLCLEVDLRFVFI